MFCLLIGPVFIRSLRRYRRRLEVTWRPEPPRSARRRADLPARRAAPRAAAATEPACRALPAARPEPGRRVRRRSGPGFSARSTAAGRASGWRRRENPCDVARRGRLARRIRQAGVRRMRDTGEIERTVLLAARRASTRASASRSRPDGRDLAKRRRNGSIAGYVSYTAFGVLALRAARELAGGATVRWLLGTQNGDGGFGGALPPQRQRHERRRAPGARHHRPGRSAAGPGGGLSALESGRGRRLRADERPQSQRSVHGIRGAGSGGRRRGRRGLSRALCYLHRLQRRDSSIAYSSNSAQTPVWVTAQALLACARAPLAAVPPETRRPRPDRRAPPTPVPLAPPLRGGRGRRRPRARPDRRRGRPAGFPAATEPRAARRKGRLRPGLERCNVQPEEVK